MLIGGILKSSLIDYPELICAVIFAQGCNFRCPYCHNMSLVEPSLFSLPIDESEVWSLLEKRRGLLDGVTISGGEPLLHKDLKNWVKRCKEMGYKVKVDTNGSCSDHLENLMASSFPPDYIAMDVKMPVQKYNLVGASEEDIRNIKRSLALLKAGDCDYELRITLWDDNSSLKDVHEMGQMIHGASQVKVQQLSAKSELLGRKLELKADRIVSILSDYSEGCFLR